MAQSFGKETNGKTEMLHCYTWMFKVRQAAANIFTVYK